MRDSANMFKKLAQNRQKSTSPETAAKTKEESKPVPESNPPEKAKAKKTTPEPSPEKKFPEPAIARDPDWIGRTYYIRKENDFDVEDELVKLKRAGINLDKSELVDFLLAAWVKWRNGENIDIQMSEISPRRKDELS